MKFSTVRQAFRPHSSRKKEQRVEDLLVRGLEDEGDLNLSIVSGPIVRDMTDDHAPDGELLKVVLISFDAAPAGVRYGASDVSAVCEIEIPRRIVDSHPHDLRVGDRIIAFGELNVMGALRATQILVGAAKPSTHTQSA